MVAPNTSSTAQTYVAVLKAKQGELLAIHSTPPHEFIPLLEVAQPGKVEAIARSWPHPKDVAWVQPIDLDGADADAWALAVADLFSGLRDRGAAAVPTVTLDETPQTYDAVRSVVAADGRGLVLRIDCEDALEDTPAALESAIRAVLVHVGVDPHQVDLVLDAGLVSGSAVVQSSAASAALAALPFLNSWRNLTVAFSGFPELVSSHVPVSSVGALPRTDAAAFAQLSSRFAARDLTYADYGVGVPTYADVSWSPIPNIRYAVDGEWIIHRAATRTNPSPQYIELARNIAAAPYFAGPAFSAGDEYIDSVASGLAGPGNAMSYLKAAMSRHFRVVLSSLATRGVP
ncbi:beta family protein [Marmoricola sp. RAF53]|uniref:beta family protein n=1 Tax=Marmoricola sp. RAF53 TaxID=3233059 RepID=UPI003F9A38FE